LPTVTVPQGLATRLALVAGQRAWLETPTISARIRLAIGPDPARADRVPILHAPSNWHNGATTVAGETLVPDPGDPDTLLTLDRLVACRLRPD
jgi:hypothetical protein